MKKKLSRKKTVQKLDKVFSQWIRAKNMNDQGIIECYTCRTKKKFNEIHAGHFMSRKSYSTRWNEQNVFPQCVGCNIYKSGMQYEFGKRLDKDFGKGTAEKLNKLSKQTIKITTPELLEMIKEYQEKIHDLDLL